MSKLYTSVPVPKFPSNTFNLSRSVLGSMSFHKMYPANIIETIPGDGFVAGSEIFGRSEPLIAPPMAKQDLDLHSFFVPDWQLSHKFDDFITGGEKYDFTAHMPYVYVSDIHGLVNKLLDYGFMPADYISDANYAQARVEAIYRTDLALRIIEHCDWLRAVPFIKPDFLSPSAIENATSLSEIEDWMTANKTAYQNLNLDLQDCGERINLLPFAAYLKVWCEFFRDENLCPDLWDWITTNGSSFFYNQDGYFLDILDYCNVLASADLNTNLVNWHLAPILEAYSGNYTRDNEWQDLEFFALKRRAWRKDRYTAALPFAQKGDDVLIPLSGTFDVVNSQDSSASGESYNASYNALSDKFYISTGGVPSSINQQVNIDNSGNAQGATIRDLRRAFAAESFQEADGQFGNRYPENTLGQFGVYTPDARLPRCQFLGSITQNMVTSEVAQTSASSETSPQGNLAGKGTVYGNGRLFRTAPTMHGFIVVMVSLRVRALYEQGINPMFSRFDRTEYAWPRFARLGEQPLYTKELFIKSQDVDEDTVFGYVPRYSEYKSDVSSVHGLLKGSRNYWTFSRRFEDTPKLNEEFIYHEPRLDAFAVVNPFEDQFTVEIDFHIKSRRKLPYWGTPVL